MIRIPVCIFAKPPVPGKVKTRLACSIGAAPAASLASAMLCDVWSIVRDCEGVMSVLAAAEEGSFPVTVPEGNLWMQGSGGLGCRLERILRLGLHLAPAAIAIGADSPLLMASHLNDALHGLETADAVIGPSCDGGFYLLGLRSCPRGLLADLPWSTAEAGELTAARLHGHGMSVRCLRTLLDVDTLADLLLLQEMLRDTRSEIAPATRIWFAEHESELRVSG
ncbi:MAG: symbB [Bryobacterales bacterium]|nr:symbB [Bryobacterales bacterium]